MKLRYSAKAIATGYWIPGDDYLGMIADALGGKVSEGDIVVVSEKALCTVKGRIIDEGSVKPSSLARFLATLWTRHVWGYLLGVLCHLKPENVSRLRNYPSKEGGAHKQVALWYASFPQALMWGSEGGIDASNLPYAYVSLPLENPQDVAQEIRLYLEHKYGKKFTVMIVDTDKTYSLGGFHFTHRPSHLRGIYSFFGFFAYVAGRTLNLKRRSTPLAVAGAEIDVDLALDLAEAAHRCRGSGAGRTVWDMAEAFGVDLTEVTWGMLKSLKHKPIVVFRRRKVS